MISWKVCYKLRIRESEELKTVFGIVRGGNSSEESRTWLAQIEDDGKKVSSKIYEMPEMEIMKETPVVKNQGTTTAVNKEV